MIAGVYTGDSVTLAAAGLLAAFVFLVEVTSRWVRRTRVQG